MQPYPHGEVLVAQEFGLADSLESCENGLYRSCEVVVDLGDGELIAEESDVHERVSGGLIAHYGVFDFLGKFVASLVDLGDDVREHAACILTQAEV